MTTKLKIDNENGVIENVADSGDITLRGGDNSVGAGDGGSVILEGGDGSATGGAGGAVFIRPGYGPGTPTIPTGSGVPEPAELWFVDGDSTPGYIGLKAPDAVSDGNTGDGNNTVLTLPEGDGAANEVMITDGAGVLSWASIAGAGGVTNPMTADLDTGGFDIVGSGASQLEIAGGSNGATGGTVWVKAGSGTTAGGNLVFSPGEDSTDNNSDGYAQFIPIVSGANPVELRFRGSNLSDFIGFVGPAAVTNDKIFKWLPELVSVAIGQSPYPVDEADDVLVVDASGGSVVINLHLAANERFRELNIKRIDAHATNTVTVNRAGADLIDGATSYVIPGNSQWTNVTLLNDKGTAWYIL